MQIGKGCFRNGFYIVAGLLTGFLQPINFVSRETSVAVAAADERSHIRAFGCDEARSLIESDGQYPHNDDLGVFKRENEDFRAQHRCHQVADGLQTFEDDFGVKTFGRAKPVFFRQAENDPTAAAVGKS